MRCTCGSVSFKDVVLKNDAFFVQRESQRPCMQIAACGFLFVFVRRYDATSSLLSWFPAGDGESRLRLE